MDEQSGTGDKDQDTIVEEGEYQGKVDVKSMLQYCYEDIGLETIKRTCHKTPDTG